jgi:phage-related protein
MWKVEFFTNSSGKSPIVEFIKQLPPESQAKARNVLSQLREFGPQLRRPYSKKLTGYKNIFELRTSGKNPLRFFYTQRQNTFIILNSFVKKSQKSPNREINLAQSRISLLT